jgi:hypothetical protein
MTNITEKDIELAREAIETAKQFVPVRFAQVHDRLAYALEQLSKSEQQEEPEDE